MQCIWWCVITPEKPYLGIPLSALLKFECTFYILKLLFILVMCMEIVVDFQFLGKNVKTHSKLLCYTLILYGPAKFALGLIKSKLVFLE